jgi:periplasmic protein TonB
MMAFFILIAAFFGLIALVSLGFSRVVILLSHRDVENLKDVEAIYWPKKLPSTDFHRYQSLLFSIGLVFSLGLTLIIFEWKSYDELEVIDLGNARENFEEVYEIPPTEQPPPPKPKLQQPEIIAVPDEEELEEEIDIVLDVEITEDTRVEKIVDLVLDEPEEEVEEVFLIVEDQPQPRGGMSAFYKFLSDYIKYPESARRVGISGRVFVEFVVDKDGSITQARVVKGIGGGCDEEAVRVVNLAPKWKPGKQRGRAVKVRMTVPVYFKLE